MERFAAELIIAWFIIMAIIGILKFLDDPGIG